MTETRTHRAALYAAILISLFLGACKSAGPSADAELAKAAERRSAGMDLAKEAQINLKNGHKELALRQYTEAVELNPDMPAAWNNMGILMMEKKDFLNAANAFRKAAELSPTDPRPYENLGLCFRTAGHGKEALEYYGKSLERDRYWLPSLRGAVLGSLEMQQVDDVLLQRIDDALMVERDATWHTEFERYRTRVAGELKIKN